MLYNKGTLVKAPNGSIGVVTGSQEKEGILARGCFVKFDDVPMVLFMSERCIAITSVEDVADYLIQERKEK